jgi:aspartyl-tRNA(Asn)/glutamyl-tRNA(Gln) amidotransferase subunit A
MLAVMQGYDAADPSTHGVAPVDPLSDLERGASGLRIGAVGDADMPLMTGEVRDAYARALVLLRDAGATIVPLALPRPLEELTSGCGDLISVEAYANWKALVDDQRAPLGAPVRARMEHGRSLKAADLVLAERRRRDTIAALLHALDRLDAFVLPTTPFVAMPVAEVDETRPLGGAHTRFVNYLELAALSLPIGLTPARLPTSLQIVVRRFDDALALRSGQAFETVRGELPLPG